MCGTCASAHPSLQEQEFTFEMRPLSNYQLRMRRVLGANFTAAPTEQRPWPHQVKCVHLRMCKRE
jgi:hypothetical protein